MEEEERNWRDARSGVRTGLGLGFEIAANTGLDAFSFIPGSQQAGSAFINYLAQKIRGGKVSKGEILAAAATSQIPGLTQAKALTRGGRLARSAAKGGIAGGVTSTSMSLVDEKRLPTFGEFAGGVGAGGLMGGAFDLVPAAVTGKLGTEVSDIKYDTDVFLRQLKSKVTGGPRIDHPAVSYSSGRPIFGEGSVGAAKPVDPKDYVSEEQKASWMTVGKQPRPLNTKFAEEAGWRGGRLNLKSWREYGSSKSIAEHWLTAPDKGVVFTTEKTKENALMSRIFGIRGAEQLLEVPEGSLMVYQAHHMTATKAVLTGQEGIVYDSPYYHELQKVWEDVELYLGNNPKNIKGTIGHIKRDLDSPHGLIHTFLDDKMGKDGTKFWTQEKLNQIVIYDADGNAIGNKNFELRKKWTKEQADIFKDAVDLFNLVTEQFYLAKGVRRADYLRTQPILDEEVVDAFINKLPPKFGTETKIVDGKTVKAYNTNVIERIAKEVAAETDIKPTIKVGSLKQLADEALADDVRNMIEKAEKIAVTSANGESMVLDLILNFPNLKPKAAIKKWTGNDPLMTTKKSIQLEKELKELYKSGAARHLKELYQRKFGELPAAVTKFDKGADD